MEAERLVTSRFQEAGLLLDRGALSLLADQVRRCEDDLQQLLGLAEEGMASLIFLEASSLGQVLIGDLMASLLQLSGYALGASSLLGMLLGSHLQAWSPRSLRQGQRS